MLTDSEIEEEAQLQAYINEQMEFHSQTWKPGSESIALSLYEGRLLKYGILLWEEQGIARAEAELAAVATHNAGGRHG